MSPDIDAPTVQLSEFAPTPLIIATNTTIPTNSAQKVIEDAGYKYLTAITLDDLNLR